MINLQAVKIISTPDKRRGQSSINYHDHTHTIDKPHPPASFVWKRSSDGHSEIERSKIIISTLGR